MLVKDTPGVVLQIDKLTGTTHTLEAKVVRVMGKKVLASIRVWGTPWGLNPDNSVNFRGWVDMEMPFGPEPGIGCFSPNDPAVLSSSLALVPAAPAEAAPQPAPVAPPPAAPAAVAAPVAAPVVAAPVPVVPPQPAAPSASGAEKMLAALENIYARQGKIEEALSRLDRIHVRQGKIEEAQILIITALKALDPYIDVLGGMRELVEAVPPSERAKESPWVRRVLKRFRTNPVSHDEEAQRELEDEDAEEEESAAPQTLVSAEPEAPAQPKPAARPAPAPSAPVEVRAEVIDPNDPDSPQAEHIPTPGEEIMRAADEVARGVPPPPEPPARNRTIDVAP